MQEEKPLLLKKHWYILSITLLSIPLVLLFQNFSNHFVNCDILEIQGYPIKDENLQKSDESTLNIFDKLKLVGTCNGDPVNSQSMFWKVIDGDAEISSHQILEANKPGLVTLKAYFVPGLDLDKEQLRELLNIAKNNSSDEDFAFDDEGVGEKDWKNKRSIFKDYYELKRNARTYFRLKRYESYIQRLNRRIKSADPSRTRHIAALQRKLEHLQSRYNRVFDSLQLVESNIISFNFISSNPNQVISLELDPHSVILKPGEEHCFKVLAMYGDKSVVDVTEQSDFKFAQGSNTGELTPQGCFSSREKGFRKIQAQFDNRFAANSSLVLIQSSRRNMRKRRALSNHDTKLRLENLNIKVPTGALLEDRELIAVKMEPGTIDGPIKQNNFGKQIPLGQDTYFINIGEGPFDKPFEVAFDLRHHDIKDSDLVYLYADHGEGWVLHAAHKIENNIAHFEFTGFSVVQSPFKLPGYNNRIFDAHNQMAFYPGNVEGWSLIAGISSILRTYSADPNLPIKPHEIAKSFKARHPDFASKTANYIKYYNSVFNKKEDITLKILNDQFNLGVGYRRINLNYRILKPINPETGIPSGSSQTPQLCIEAGGQEVCDLIVNKEFSPLLDYFKYHLQQKRPLMIWMSRSKKAVSLLGYGFDAGFGDYLYIHDHSGTLKNNGIQEIGVESDTSIATKIYWRDLYQLMVTSNNEYLDVYVLNRPIPDASTMSQASIDLNSFVAFSNEGTIVYSDKMYPISEGYFENLTKHVGNIAIDFGVNNPFVGLAFAIAPTPFHDGTPAASSKASEISNIIDEAKLTNTITKIKSIKNVRRAVKATKIVRNTAKAVSESQKEIPAHIKTIDESLKGLSLILNLWMIGKELSNILDQAKVEFGLGPFGNEPISYQYLKHDRRRPILQVIKDSGDQFPNLADKIAFKNKEVNTGLVYFPVWGTSDSPRAFEVYDGMRIPAIQEEKNLPLGVLTSRALKFDFFINQYLTTSGGSEIENQDLGVNVRVKSLSTGKVVFNEPAQLDFNLLKDSRQAYALVELHELDQQDFVDTGLYEISADVLSKGVAQDSIKFKFAYTPTFSVQLSVLKFMKDIPVDSEGFTRFFEIFTHEDDYLSLEFYDQSLNPIGNYDLLKHQNRYIDKLNQVHFLNLPFNKNAVAYKIKFGLHSEDSDLGLIENRFETDLDIQLVGQYNSLETIYKKANIKGQVLNLNDEPVGSATLLIFQKNPEEDFDINNVKNGSLSPIEIATTDAKGEYKISGILNKYVEDWQVTPELVIVAMKRDKYSDIIILDTQVTKKPIETNFSLDSELKDGGCEEGGPHCLCIRVTIDFDKVRDERDHKTSHLQGPGTVLLPIGENGNTPGLSGGKLIIKRKWLTPGTYEFAFQMKAKFKTKDIYGTPPGGRPGGCWSVGNECHEYGSEDNYNSVWDIVMRRQQQHGVHSSQLPKRYGTHQFMEKANAVHHIKGTTRLYEYFSRGKKYVSYTWDIEYLSAIGGDPIPENASERSTLYCESIPEELRWPASVYEPPPPPPPVIPPPPEEDELEACIEECEGNSLCIAECHGEEELASEE